VQKDIRKYSLVNLLGRNILKVLPQQFDKLKLRWRTSGIVRINFNNISFKMRNCCDDGIVDQLYFKLKYSEVNDLKQFLRLIKPDSVILDIGSNTGIYSILSGKSEPNSKIFAIEPNPVNFKRLEENIKLNELSNIQVSRYAIGANTQKIELNVPKNNIISDTTSVLEDFSKSTYQGKIEWKKIDVKQVSIDEFCSLHNLEKIDLIKVDVEGYEIEVLKGASTQMKKNRPKILLETFPDEDKRNWLMNFLEKHEYQAFCINSNGLQMDTSSLSKKEGYNYLFLPKEFDLENLD